MPLLRKHVGGFIDPKDAVLAKDTSEVVIKKTGIKTAELISALSKIRSGVSTKGLIEGFGNYSLDNDFIRTYNDHICISYPFKTGIVASVKADDLNAVLSKIDGETIELSVVDNSLLIKGGNTKAGLIKTDTVKHIPINGEWKDLPEDFLHGLSLCSFSAADTMSMGILYCIYVNKKKLYSSDNYRISRYELEKEIDDTFLIPAKSAEEVSKFHVNKYLLDESWVHFKAEHSSGKEFGTAYSGAIFSCRIVNGVYKDVDRFFTVEGKEFTLPTDIKKYVDSSLVMADGKREFEKKIEMKISKDSITLRGETESGWIESKVPCQIDIEENFKVDINPVFLNEVLNKSTSIILREGRALFKSENFQHVMVLP